MMCFVRVRSPFHHRIGSFSWDTTIHSCRLQMQLKQFSSICMNAVRRRLYSIYKWRRHTCREVELYTAIHFGRSCIYCIVCLLLYAVAFIYRPMHFKLPKVHMENDSRQTTVLRRKIKNKRKTSKRKKKCEKQIVQIFVCVILNIKRNDAKIIRPKTTSTLAPIPFTAQRSSMQCASLIIMQCSTHIHTLNRSQLTCTVNLSEIRRGARLYEILHINHVIRWNNKEQWTDKMVTAIEWQHQRRRTDIQQ